MIRCVTSDPHALHRTICLPIGPGALWVEHHSNRCRRERHNQRGRPPRLISREARLTFESVKHDGGRSMDRWSGASALPLVSLHLQMNPPPSRPESHGNRVLFVDDSRRRSPRTCLILINMGLSGARVDVDGQADPDCRMNGPGGRREATPGLAHGRSVCQYCIQTLGGCANALCGSRRACNRRRQRHR
jgi:hypothetical protein